MRNQALNENDKLELVPDLGYIPALDGLRAIAVILVLLTHAGFQLGDNGILGVDIFFALSGFLITTLLLEENYKRGAISLTGFYIRRTLRLFPALYTMLFVVLGYGFIYKSGDEQFALYMEVIASGLYISNISWLWGWGQVAWVSMLGHTWTLAVEEQFYLLWPLILFLSLKFRLLRALTLGLPSFIVIILILKLTGNLSSLTEALIHESIFIGCFAAIIRHESESVFKIPDYLVFFLMVFILIVGVFPVTWYMQLKEAGGRSIIAVITIIIIIAITNNQLSFTARLLSAPWLVWVGKISYALYLWHLPVFRVFRFHSDLPPAASFILKFIVSILLAGLSWVLIEKRATVLGRRISQKNIRFL